MLREIVRRDLPPEVLRAPKRGFSVPLADWFRKEARDQIRDGLLRSILRCNSFIEEKPRTICSPIINRAKRTTRCGFGRSGF